MQIPIGLHLFVYLQHDFEKKNFDDPCEPSKRVKSQQHYRGLFYSASNVWLCLWIQGPWPPLTWPVHGLGQISTQLLLYMMGLFVWTPCKKTLLLAKVQLLDIELQPTFSSVFIWQKLPPLPLQPSTQYSQMRTLAWSTSDSHLGKIYGTGVGVHAIKIHLQNI